MEESYCTSLPSGWALVPRYAGWEHCRRGHRWAGVRDHFLLHLVVEGKGMVRSRQGAEQLAPGDVFIYWPNVRCDYQADLIDPWSYVWVGFAGSAARDFAMETGTRPGLPVLHPARVDQLETNIRSIARELSIKHNGFVARATGLLYLVLGELAGASPAERARTDVQREQLSPAMSARQFMDQNFRQPISVSDVAEHVGFSRSHLSRCFTTQFGCTMGRYLTSLRMRRARDMVEHSSLRFAEVAHSVGYRSYEVFERRYREEFGEFPGALRLPPDGRAQPDTV